MKNGLLFTTLLLSFLVGAAKLANAQITITKSNMPVAGNNYIYTSSNDSINVSVTGANQTWDYSKIVPVSQDTFKYLTALKASILYYASFTTDAALDLKLANLKGAYSFFKTTSTQYSQAGMGITIPGLGLPTALVYQKQDIIYNFPMNYGNIDSCHFLDTTTIIQGITIKIVGKRVNTVDGWGKVTTPYKTYDCIRIKSVVTEVDSFVGVPIDRSRVEYKWWSTSENIPVMEAIVTPNATGAGSTFALHYRDSYKVIVNPNGPQVDFNVADTNVFINSDSILFNNKTTGALTYAWTITPSTWSYAAATKATSKNPQVIFHAPGLYTVSLAATGVGGSNTLTKTHYINATHNTGIAPSIENHGLSIYPNPTNGDLFLHFNGVQNLEKSDITVTDIFGQTILQKTVSAGQNDVKLSLNGFSAGVYFVKCQVGGESFVKKVVVR